MKTFYSDDPAMDFTRWDAEQERNREKHHRGSCAHCGADIYEYDDYYDFEGEWLVHDNCLVDWAAQYKK